MGTGAGIEAGDMQRTEDWGCPRDGLQSQGDAGSAEVRGRGDTEPWRMWTWLRGGGDQGV